MVYGSLDIGPTWRAAPLACWLPARRDGPRERADLRHDSCVTSAFFD
jgi:hypothetical protein